jgi:hypothetical protein
MEFDDIERMIAKKTAQAGNLLYKYPGQLEESDEEWNAGDLEDIVSNSLSENDLESDSDDSWAKDDGSNFSFNSEKLIDGYKDFLVFQLKMQAKKAKEDAEAAKHGGFGKKVKKVKKSKKSKKSEDIPFGRKTSPTSEEAPGSRSRSPSLDAVADYNGKLIFNKKNEEEPECELNLSFSGGYVPNTDLSRVDKGLGNPQFCGVNLN